ncbi:signal peptidase I [Streptomyces actuosus]|uniref:Signal peptidase I n=1 Tax=Streptomyces actuosus TaxID=1885 RepID=A0ABS2VS49_STRAS|nr:signal peptidase I [Streptomyces actuosus]MBN0045939.1 signal peptidase I [Streptomyces actuosus]
MSGKGRGLGIAAVAVGLVGLLLGLGGAGLGRYVYGGAVMNGGSMAPTYGTGDRVVYERGDGSTVRRGDVVVFTAPERYGFDGLVVARVIGVGGDRVACCTGTDLGGRGSGRVTVDGTPLQEPYLRGRAANGGLAPYDVRVPEGRLFLLGDNRANSRDSRVFPDDHGGTLPVSAVRGRVVGGALVPVVLGSAMLLGVVLVLVGVGLGIAAVVVRRRPRAAVPPPPPVVRA